MITHPVAVAAPLLPLLSGPPSTGTVLARMSCAVLVGIDDHHAAPQVLTLLGERASGVPNGIRVADPALLTALGTGMPVQLGAGRVVLPMAVLRPARSWRTAVRQIRPAPAALGRLAARLVGVPIGLAGADVDRLAVALRCGDVLDVVRGLIGLGAGLTPGGDDLLAGTLVGLRASGRAVLLQQLRLAIGPGTDALTERTTAVSAALLTLAAAGHAMTEVLALLGALNAAAGRLPAPDPFARRADPLDAAVDKVLAVGHTSGADLATGLLLGLTAGAAPATGGRSSAAAPPARSAGRKVDR